MSLLVLLIVILISYIGSAYFLFGFFLTKKDLNIYSNECSSLSVYFLNDHKNNLCLSQEDKFSIWNMNISFEKDIINHYHQNNDRTSSIPTNFIIRTNPTNFSETKSNNNPNSYKRIILLIVDALRLDFVTQHDATDESHHTSSSYNNFKNMHNLLRHNASECRLYGFRGDPPTTTSQRLKGLTTGSLPTFIDIGYNFNSASIQDDNIIDQLLRLIELQQKDENKQHTMNNTHQDNVTSNNNNSTNNTIDNNSLIYLGDDTWHSLFPTQFSTQFSHPFDSFNTQDIDTVDCGVLSTLYSHFETVTPLHTNDHPADSIHIYNGLEYYKSYCLHRNNTFIPSPVSSTITNDIYHHDTNSSTTTTASNIEWKLLIAHFLGVDHVGHTHHARHPLMKQKLQLMDQVLSDVVSLMSEDTLLLLFGDHGMTDSGEHGGASDSELISGLFVYSKLPLFMTRDKKDSSSCDSNNTNNTNNSSCENNNHTNTPLLSADSAPIKESYAFNYTTHEFEWKAIDELLYRPTILNQVDLVPTLSVLFNLIPNNNNNNNNNNSHKSFSLPIPFSSLGSVIPDLLLQPSVQEIIFNDFNNNDDKSNNSDSNYCVFQESLQLFNHKLLLQSLLLNSLQVMKYLQTYFLSSSTLSSTSSSTTASVVNNLRVSLIKAIDTHYELLQISTNQSICQSHNTLYIRQAITIINNLTHTCVSLYMKFLSDALALGRIQFTQFNLTYMTIGITLIALCTLCVIVFLIRHVHHMTERSTSGLTIHQCKHTIDDVVKCNPPVLCTNSGSSGSFCNCDMCNSYNMSVSMMITAFVITVLTLFHAVSVLSNSFIIQEGVLLYFILQASHISIILDLIKCKDSTLTQSMVHTQLVNVFGMVICTYLASPYCLLTASNTTAGTASNTETKSIMKLMNMLNTRISVDMILFLTVIIIIVKLLLKTHISYKPHTTYNQSTYDSHSTSSSSNYKPHTTYNQSDTLLEWCHNRLLILSCSLLIMHSSVTTFTSIVVSAVIWVKHLELCIVISLALSFVCLLVNTGSTKTADLLSVPSSSYDSAVYDNIPAYLSHPSSRLFATLVCLVLLLTDNWLSSIRVIVMIASLIMFISLCIATTFKNTPLQNKSISPISASKSLATEIVNMFSEIPALKCIFHHKYLHIKFSRNQHYVGIAVVVTLYVCHWGRFLFFITNHKFDFAYLQLKVGFIGVNEFHYYYAGLLLALNTFGYELLVIAVLIFIFPAILNNIIMQRGNENLTKQQLLVDNKIKNANECKLETGNMNSKLNSLKTSDVHNVKLLINNLYVCYRLIILCWSLICAFIHRRHLMMWAIFAPKIIFECSLFAFATLVYGVFVLFTSIW